MYRYACLSTAVGLFAIVISACPSAETTPESDAGAATSPSQGQVGSAGKSAAMSGGDSGQSSDQDAGATDGVPTKPVSRACVVGGCSSQLCTDSASGPVISTCEWREEYACYRSATCAKQADGKCGWTPTPELDDCLKSAGARL